MPLPSPDRWSGERLLRNMLLVALLVVVQGARTPARPEPLPAWTADLLVNDADRSPDLESRLALLDQAASLDPDAVRVVNERALVLEQLQHYTPALGALTSAISKNQQEAALRFNAANLHLAFGRLDRAIRTYSQAIRLEPTSAALLNRGTAYFLQSKYDKAVQDYSRALKLDGPEPLAYEARAAAYVRLGRSRAARADYRRLLELAPDHVLSREMLRELQPGEEKR